MTTKHRAVFSVVFGFIVLISNKPLLAATSSSAVAASQQLTSQAEKFREEQKKKPLEPEEKPLIIQEKERQAPEKIEGPRFTVTKIKLEGNTVLSSESFEKLIAPYQNKETSFEELTAVAEKITDAYIAAGHSTSQAFIPPQKLEDGVATIKIMEGKVGTVRVEGNHYYRKEVYEDAIRLRTDRVFSYQDLESSLYYLNQKPGVKAKGYIVPGEKPETSDIVLKTEETYPLHVYYGFNNRGTRLTHRQRHEAHFDNDNLLGYGDTLNTAFSMAEEGAFNAGFVSYEFPIESTGTTLNLDTSYVESRLIGDLESEKIVGKNFSVFPSVTQNLVRSLKFVLDWFLGFDFTDSKTLQDGTKINFDRMRVLKTGPRMTFQDPGGRTLLSGDVDWGVPASSGGDFVYYTASLARIQRLPASMYLILRTNGQWTDDTLTSVEEFRAGGAYSVRGYPESDAVGDYGYNLSAELNTPVPFLPNDREIPHAKKKVGDAVRMVVFVDGAKTTFRERTSETSVKDSFLLGAGLGVRVNLAENIALQLDFGWPIGDDSSEKNRIQTHIALKAGF